MESMRAKRSAQQKNSKLKSENNLPQQLPPTSSSSSSSILTSSAQALASGQPPGGEDIESFLGKFSLPSAAKIANRKGVVGVGNKVKPPVEDCHEDAAARFVMIPSWTCVFCHVHNSDDHATLKQCVSCGSPNLLTLLEMDTITTAKESPNQRRKVSMAKKVEGIKSEDTNHIMERQHVKKDDNLVNDFPTVGSTLASQSINAIPVSTVATDKSELHHTKGNTAEDEITQPEKDIGSGIEALEDKMNHSSLLSPATNSDCTVNRGTNCASKSTTTWSFKAYEDRDEGDNPGTNTVEENKSGKFILTTTPFSFATTIDSGTDTVPFSFSFPVKPSAVEEHNPSLFSFSAYPTTTSSTSSVPVFMFGTNINASETGGKESKTSKAVSTPSPSKAVRKKSTPSSDSVFVFGLGDNEVSFPPTSSISTPPVTTSSTVEVSSATKRLSSEGPMASTDNNPLSLPMNKPAVVAPTKNAVPSQPTLATTHPTQRDKNSGDRNNNNSSSNGDNSTRFSFDTSNSFAAFLAANKHTKFSSLQLPSNEFTTSVASTLGERRFVRPTSKSSNNGAGNSALLSTSTMTPPNTDSGKVAGLTFVPSLPTASASLSNVSSDGKSNSINVVNNPPSSVLPKTTTTLRSGSGDSVSSVDSHTSTTNKARVSTAGGGHGRRRRAIPAVTPPLPLLPSTCGVVSTEGILSTEKVVEVADVPVRAGMEGLSLSKTIKSTDNVNADSLNNDVKVADVEDDDETVCDISQTTDTSIDEIPNESTHPPEQNASVLNLPDNINATMTALMVTLQADSQALVNQYKANQEALTQEQARNRILEAEVKALKESLTRAKMFYDPDESMFNSVEECDVALMALERAKEKLLAHKMKKNK